MVDFPTLGRPTIPQLRGMVLQFPSCEAISDFREFVLYRIVHWAESGLLASGTCFTSSNLETHGFCRLQVRRSCCGNARGKRVCSDDTSYHDYARRCSDAGADFREKARVFPEG